MPPYTSSEWRSVHKSLLKSKKWRRTTDDARSLYIALLLTSDAFGAFIADSDDIELSCFPGIPSWSDEARIETAIDALHEIELIRLHTTDINGVFLDRVWGWIVDFDAHQPARYIQKRGNRQSPIPPTEHTGPYTGPYTRPPLEVELEVEIDKEESTNVLLSANTDESTKPKIDKPQIVWDHWLTVAAPIQFKKPTRLKLSSDRRTRIATRLKDGYSVADLTLSIDGFVSDDFHRGKNPQRTPYLDIPTIFKTASKVDAGIAFANRRRVMRNGASLVAPQSVPS